MNANTYEFLMIMSIFLLSLSIIGIITCAFMRIVKEYRRAAIDLAQYLETVNRR